MTRVSTGIALAAILCDGVLCQQIDIPLRFEIADVHSGTTSVAARIAVNLASSGRFELHSATMVDLIGIAYGSDRDKIVGGPDWLETDRFDVIAKSTPGAGKEALNAMLQTLLADRFKLAVHTDTRPIAAYVLKAGLKPRLKTADGSADAGCKPEAPSASLPQGYTRGSIDGLPVLLGPDRTAHYICRNMSMAAFAEAIPGLAAFGVAGPVLDRTGLKGAWNFDLRWSSLPGLASAGAAARISIFDAIDKQLGLKLEKDPVPAPVIVVDSVNRKPTPNPPDVKSAFPVIPSPEKFDLAVIKPADPNSLRARFLVQPGGRVLAEAMTLRQLVDRAVHLDSNDPVVGLPDWAGIQRFDITAQAPAGTELNAQDAGVMLRALLADRFQLATHNSQQPVPVYELVARKPKLNRADPANRESCKRPPGIMLPISISCQNMPMAQFASQLRNLVPAIDRPVVDATALEGRWDFTLSYTPPQFLQSGRGPAAGLSDGPETQAPDGALSIFEALEKELGLRLEARTRTIPVIVVDHVLKMPTDN